jgi:hypothetical protein
MSPGKILIASGVVLIVIGLLVSAKGGIPFLGRLPGDFRIERENFSFYFPLGTCLVISAVVSILLWLFRR